MDFHNCYDNEGYAAAYAKLEFPGTYYLAFRDLPDILAGASRGAPALDFGCGAGRSTRFLARLGFDAVGVDAAAAMIQQAKSIDPAGDYRLVADDLSEFADARFGVILSAFTFDNIPGPEKKVALFRELRRVLSPEGRLVNLVSSPEIYWNEWASFSTKGFPENRHARCGDHVRILVTALDSPEPAIDILWPDEAYRDVYAQAGFTVREVHRPLGRVHEPYPWVNETTVAPWVIYVLGRWRGHARVDTR